jgi:hypothetical protein
MMFFYAPTATFSPPPASHLQIPTLPKLNKYFTDSDTIHPLKQPNR